MKYYELEDIVVSHFESLENAASSLDKHMDKESIHKFRTEYKKLRAWLRLTDDCVAAPAIIGINEDLKDNYKHLGEVRDRQIHRERIKTKTNGHPIQPKKYLSQLEDEMDEYFGSIDLKQVPGTVKENRSVLPGEVQHKDRECSVENYINSKWQSVAQIITEYDFTDENIHKIRKLLKDIFYICFKGGLKMDSAVLVLNKEQLKSLLDLLGDHQDCVTAMALLSEDQISGTGEEKIMLTEVRSIIMEEKIHLKIRVEQALKELLNVLNSGPSSEADQNKVNLISSLTN